MRNSILFPNIPGDPMENVRLRKNPEGLYDDPVTTTLIINKFLVEVMRIDEKVVQDMLFECLHRLDKYVQGKKYSFIVKFVLDEEIQIMLGKRRMLNGTPTNIIGLFAPQSQNARVYMKLFLNTLNTSNEIIMISKDKVHMDGKAVVILGKNGALKPKDYLKESMERVEYIPMLQQAGPKDYNKNTFTG